MQGPRSKFSSGGLERQTSKICKYSTVNKQVMDFYNKPSLLGEGGGGPLESALSKKGLNYLFKCNLLASGRRLAISNIFFTALNALSQLSAEIAVIFF